MMPYEVRSNSLQKLKNQKFKRIYIIPMDLNRNTQRNTFLQKLVKFGPERINLVLSLSFHPFFLYNFFLLHMYCFISFVSNINSNTYCRQLGNTRTTIEKHFLIGFPRPSRPMRGIVSRERYYYHGPLFPLGMSPD